MQTLVRRSGENDRLAFGRAVALDGAIYCGESPSTSDLRAVLSPRAAKAMPVQ
jgi:hypothetical protein